MTDVFTEALDQTARAPRDGFRAELLATIEDEWRGVVVALTEPGPARHERRLALWIGSAAAVAIGLGSIVYATTRSSSAPVIAPSTTVAPPQTTVTPPSTTEPSVPVSTASTTPAFPTAFGSPELATWLTARMDEGYTQSDVRTDESTDARLIIEHRQSSSVVGPAVVLLADHRVVAMPDNLSTYQYNDLRLLGLGDTVALFQRADGHVSLWVLDEAAATWSAVELGLGSILDQSSPWVSNVAGSLLIGVLESGDPTDPASAQVNERGLIVAPDLSITEVTQPPVGISMSWWTTVSGTHALIMGLDVGAGDQPPLTQPWSFDIVSNTWTAVPQPDWVDCGPEGLECAWTMPHEFGDTSFLTTTPLGVLTLTPDGTLGLFDPDTSTWRQIETPPFQPSFQLVVMQSEQRLLAFHSDPNGSRYQLGTIGILDLSNGSWSTATLTHGEIPDKSVAWDIRFNDDVIMVGTLDESFTPTEAPVVVIDRINEGSTDEDEGAWFTPTPEHIALWHQLFTGSTDTSVLIDG